ncbi:hypothetical protein GCM10027280_26070 [Micromonospora polyrhachis]|uniref:Uncharacterized protein n=1 Tax=Micromonospora polyrhachis TaxID=1282883 RepID=A0A7W7WR94_9ACTN|nr:hypothetical protein [Micromonospora polyrhachis]MBB4960302.1 hypothetical protein [Micromonospora polyrhachis]
MILGAEEAVFGDLLGPSLGTLPTMLVLVVGLILVAVAGKRLPGRARVLAFLGGAVLLLELLLALAWGLAIPTLFREGVFNHAEFTPISLVVSLLLSLMQAAGIGLLIGAVLAGRTARTEPTATPTTPSAAPAAWSDTPTSGTPAQYPTMSAPYPPASAPPAPAQWTPPTS